VLPVTGGTEEFKLARGKASLNFTGPRRVAITIQLGS